jgi:transcriptional regulator with XRE-family HTH domain
MPKRRTADPDAIRFGAILRRLRGQRGWTLRKLATRADMNAIYIGVLELGQNVPSLSTVLELLEVLEADIPEVMGELAAARKAPRVKADQG